MSARSFTKKFTPVERTIPASTARNFQHLASATFLVTVLQREHAYVNQFFGCVFDGTRHQSSV